MFTILFGIPFFTFTISIRLLELMKLILKMLVEKIQSLSDLS